MFEHIKINGARLDQLSTDADFKAEALRLLPQAAKQLAEKLWQMKKRELKLGSCQRSSFVSDAMRPYRNRNSAASRDMLATIEKALINDKRGTNGMC
jgi:hypothetical protein